MKLLVTSDTHLENPRRLDLPISEFDALVHAGDFVSQEVYDTFDEYDLHAVYGNADENTLKSSLRSRVSFDVGGVTVGVVHGHTLGAPQQLEYTAAELDADLLVYGHSHKPSFAGKSAGLVNPGSPTEPRGYPPTYAVLSIEGGSYEGQIVDLRNNDELISIEGDQRTQ